MRLQNHPGDTEFPVAWRWRYGKNLRALMRPVEIRLWYPSLVAAGAVGLVIGLVLLSASFVHTPIFVLFSALAAYRFAPWLMRAALVGRPWLEQRTYIKLSGNRILTERQQQLLALTAYTDFAAGLWNSSLEYRPAVVAVPTSARERAGRLVVLRPSKPEEVRAGLMDSESGLLPDFSEKLEGLRAENSLSWQLLSVLEGPDGADVAARLARILGTSPDHVLGLAYGSPSKLLWAWDSQRAVDLTRDYYVAGALSAEEAWTQIAEIARVPFEIFSSWDEYWDNLRIAIAFTSNSLPAVRAFDSRRAQFTASKWPAASIPFPSTTGNELPAVVRAMRPSPGPEL